jgi:5-methylthioadenosine/S-adenosylhomocysteine deaminase
VISPLPLSDRSWFVHGGLVLDPADGEPRRRELVVCDGVIAATFEPGPDAAAAGAGLPRYDAADVLVLPGLINAHTHGHANLMKGVADRWPLEVSLTSGPALGGRRDVETTYVSTLLGAIEMLSRGITSCYDLVYEFPCASKAGIEAVAQAYADAGMRAVLAPMVADRTLFEAYPEMAAALPAALAEAVGAFALAPLAETMAVLEELVATAAFPEGIRLGIAPTIPLHCSEAMLAGCRDLAVRAGLPVHMHLAESRLQATAGERRFGRSLTAYVADCGLLGPAFTAAHGVWLDDGDLDLIAQAGASIVHVPASNFRLGSGVADIRPMIERGIDVALATDGCNCSDSLDMFLAMRLASFASRSHAGHRDGWLTSLEVFRAATIGGAAAIGMRERLGRPVAGYAADLVFVDLAHHAFVPLNDPLNQIVNCDAASAVRDVMVAGRFVVRDGRLPAWTAAIRSRIAVARERLHSQTQPARELAGQLDPFVARYVADRGDDPIAIERHVRSPLHRVRSFS